MDSTYLSKAMEAERWNDTSLSREIEELTRGSLSVTPASIGNYRKGTTYPPVNLALVIAYILKSPVEQLFRHGMQKLGLPCAPINLADTSTNSTSAAH